MNTLFPQKKEEQKGVGGQPPPALRPPPSQPSLGEEDPHAVGKALTAVGDGAGDEPDRRTAQELRRQRVQSQRGAAAGRI